MRSLVLWPRAVISTDLEFGEWFIIPKLHSLALGGKEGLREG